MIAENDKPAAGVEREKEDRLVRLYEEYFPKIARYVFVHTGDKTESEDIASEVFLKALDSLNNYQERGLPMQAWLFRIAHNLVVDHLRKAERYKKILLEKTDVPDMTDPAAEAEISLEMLRVNQAMKDLTEDQREVVRMRFFGGLTSRETAEALNKSDGAVREMQRAALEKLRRILK